MDFRILVIIFSCFLLLLGCQSNNIVRKTHLSLELDEINGIKKYQEEEYEEAFELLKTPATWGYKGAQYVMAFMFLKGQHVEQSTLLGMGWLGVATEIETEEWSDQYRALYNAAEPKFQKRIDKIVEEYIRRYGMKSQHVVCSKSPTTRSRAVKHVCTKSDNLSVIYDVDLVE
ncbi:SEL1-like repeat protein [Pseudoalteromonas xiamenensis]